MNEYKQFLMSKRVLKRFSHHFLGISEKISGWFTSLALDLKQSELNINKLDYISYALASSLLYFFLLSLLLFFITGLPEIILFVFILILLHCFRLIQYPKYLTIERVKKIETNLLVVLRNMLVQVNSNIPLFTIMANLSEQNFGEVSNEFKKIVKKINSGMSEAQALEESATNTPSVFFRTVLWQIINGIRAGSNISDVLKDLINMLTGEQIDQIQEYGASLNSLSMFYMLMVIIIPSLATTFLIAGATFFANATDTIKMSFFMIYIVVVLFQIIFLGVIKSKRPSLLRS